jgi:hypothetical protein
MLVNKNNIQIMLNDEKHAFDMVIGSTNGIIDTEDEWNNLIYIKN